MPGANNFIYEKNLEINKNQQQEINNPENNKKININNDQINNITAEDRNFSNFKIKRRWKLHNKINT